MFSYAFRFPRHEQAANKYTFSLSFSLSFNLAHVALSSSFFAGVSWLMGKLAPFRLHVIITSHFS